MVVNTLLSGRESYRALRARRQRRQRLRVRALITADVLAALVGAVIAYGWHTSGSDMSEWHTASLRIAIGIMPLTWVAALYVCHAYDRGFIGWLGTYHRVLRASVLVAAFVAGICLVVDNTVLVRQALIGIPLAAALTPVARRMTARWWREPGSARDRHRCLLVGDARVINAFLAAVRPERSETLHVVGACLPEPLETIAHTPLGVSILGGLADIDEAARATGCDVVLVLNCPELDGAALRQLSWQLSEDQIDLVLAPILAGVASDRIGVATVDGVPLLTVRPPMLSGPQRMLKELLERSAAALLLALLSPLMATVALIVRATTPGPAFFRQTRVGAGGREFTLLKFRTMVANAELLRSQLEERNEVADGPLFKIRDDPRVTRVGVVLRKYSIDELPQLINVLTGSMSLVGPRPPLPKEVAGYTDEMCRRLAVKPGLTGLWQVSGRSTLSWPESVRLDVSYVENWSPVLDAMILLRTPSAVVRGKGAF